MLKAIFILTIGAVAVITTGCETMTSSGLVAQSPAAQKDYELLSLPIATRFGFQRSPVREQLQPGTSRSTRIPRPNKWTQSQKVDRMPVKQRTASMRSATQHTSASAGVPQAGRDPQNLNHLPEADGFCNTGKKSDLCPPGDFQTARDLPEISAVSLGENRIVSAT